MNDIINVFKNFSIDFSSLFHTIFVISISVFVTAIFIKITNVTFDRICSKMRSEKNPNITYISFSKYLVIAFIYFLSIIVIISNIKFLQNIMTSLLAGSGILALVIGLASQEAVGNIVSGFLILVFKPFVIGDFVRYIDKNIVGTVEDITLRHTIIRTLENKRVIVPNGVINKEVIENANYLDSKICTLMDFCITYESDLDLAEQIIVKTVISHRDYHDTRTDDDRKDGMPPVLINLAELGENGVVLRASVWSTDGTAKAYMMKSDILRSVKDEFKKNKIDFAYPHIVVMDK